MAIEAVVRRGGIRRVLADAAKAERFLAQAQETLADAASAASPKTRFDIGYNAAHDCGEGVLAAYGLATASGPGQHVVVGEVLRAVFDRPPAQRAAQRFEHLRQVRNSLRYRALPVAAEQGDDAIEIAALLLAGAAEQLGWTDR